MSKFLNHSKCFLAPKVNIFMKKIVFDDSLKVWEGLKHVLKFLKFPCGPPFGSASEACGPPFGLASKFLNH